MYLFSKVECPLCDSRLCRTSIPAEWTYFGGSLVGPACRAGLRGLPRPFDVIRSTKRSGFLKTPGGGDACSCACGFGFAERPFRQNGPTLQWPLSAGSSVVRGQETRVKQRKPRTTERSESLGLRHKMVLSSHNRDWFPSDTRTAAAGVPVPVLKCV